MDAIAIARHPQGRHRYRNVIEGCAMAAEFRRSGLTVAEFSRQKGVSRKMILYWTGRERELAASRPQELVEVAAVSAPAPAAAPPASTASTVAGLEVRLPNGIAIAVSSTFDASLLREVVRALAAPC
jgi:hypothetical protein